MTARTRTPRRFDVPPTEGTVEIRLRGRPEDIAELAEILTALTGATVRHNRDRSYRDGNGVTVRYYLTADLRGES